MQGGKQESHDEKQRTGCVWRRRVNTLLRERASCRLLIGVAGDRARACSAVALASKDAICGFRSEKSAPMSPSITERATAVV